MIKKAVAILVLSLAVIMAMPYVHRVLEFLLALHAWISTLLTEVFTGAEAGTITRQLIALLAVPILAGLVPSLCYWLIKRSWFPYFSQCVWIVWLIQTSALVALMKI